MQGDLRKLYGVETGNGLLPYGSQVHTTFYVACAAVAVDHLHRRWFIHRDVKPENLLMDGRGYVKLTDMGFAKQVTEDPRRGHEDMKIKTPAVCASQLKRFKLGTPSLF